MLLEQVAVNLGVSLLPASAMTLHAQGIVYHPLADVNVDITVETVVVWCREEISSLVQELLVVVREVLGQQKKDDDGCSVKTSFRRGEMYRINNRYYLYESGWQLNRCARGNVSGAK